MEEISSHLILLHSKEPSTTSKIPTFAFLFPFSFCFYSRHSIAGVAFPFFFFSFSADHSCCDQLGGKTSAPLVGSSHIPRFSWWLYHYFLFFRSFPFPFHSHFLILSAALCLLSFSLHPSCGSRVASFYS